MSSAILYLAIVVIWAGVLVPRWVRKSHHGPGAAGGTGSGESGAAGVGGNAAGQGPGEASAAGSHAAAAVYTDGAAHEHGVGFEHGMGVQHGMGFERGVAFDHGVAFEYDATFEHGEVHADGAVLEYETSVEYGAAVECDAVLKDGGAGYDDAGGGPDDDITEPVLALRGRLLWSDGPGWRPLRRRQDRPEPGVTHEAALRARRRMLTTLVTLTVAALALTAGRMAPWWVIVPPAGMLGVLMLLLHEAARADAEAVQREAAAQAAYAARQARLAARKRARDEALAGRIPEPTAEIIDISARVGDQFYDQYADAAVRAVGD